ncbi:MAG: hypothetical protein RLZZ385_704 [Pseudomonadota bacterium]|jgi:LmbE family N-acetylglucosaminyl deacetylase
MLNPEHLLVPYEAGPLPGGPWLVFAPHADDETFGMGGSLRKAADAGIETHVIVLTDGALGGNEPDLVRTRHREVQQATELLGVTSLSCWTEPDRGLAPSPRLLDRIRAAITGLEPASVFFPGPLELHPDHRMTALLVWQVLAQLPSPPAALAYEISVQNPTNRLIDISAQLASKQQAMAVYVSQNGQNNYPDLITAMNITRTFTLPAAVTHAEAFYLFEVEDLQQPLLDVVHQVVELYR